MFFRSVISVALLAAYAAADIAFTSWPSSVEAGSTYPLTWSGGDSSVCVNDITVLNFLDLQFLARYHSTPTGSIHRSGDRRNHHQ